MVIKPCKRKKTTNLNWCRISAINRMCSWDSMVFSFHHFNNDKSHWCYPSPHPAQAKKNTTSNSFREEFSPSVSLSKKKVIVGAFFFLSSVFFQTKIQKKSWILSAHLFQAKFPKPECTSALFLGGRCFSKKKPTMPERLGRNSGEERALKIPGSNGT